MDNGVNPTAPAYWQVIYNSSVATIYKDLAGIGWTNAGSKNFGGIIFYEI